MERPALLVARQTLPTMKWSRQASQPPRRVLILQAACLHIDSGGNDEGWSRRDEYAG